MELRTEGDVLAKCTLFTCIRKSSLGLFRLYLGSHKILSKFVNLVRNKFFFRGDVKHNSMSESTPLALTGCPIFFGKSIYLLYYQK